MTMKLHAWALPAAFTLMLMACSEHSHEDVDEELCEHLQDGPAAPVTAGIDDATAPLIVDNHKRYDVTFVDSAGAKAGKVRIEAQAGTYVFAMNADVPVAITALANGVAIAPSSAAKSSATCSDVRARYEVPFLTAGTYVLTLGPTAVASVGVVVERDSHEH